MPLLAFKRIVIFLLLFSSCVQNISKLDFHNSINSEESFLFADENNIYMSWIESDSLNNYLYYSKLENNKWSKKELIVEGDNWFINWADFPSISRNSKNGKMMAHYLKKSYDLTLSYDIKFLIKNEQWSNEKLLHSDNTKSELIEIVVGGNPNIWEDELNEYLNDPSEDKKEDINKKLRMLIKEMCLMPEYYLS